MDRGGRRDLRCGAGGDGDSGYGGDSGGGGGGSGVGGGGGIFEAGLDVATAHVGAAARVASAAHHVVPSLPAPPLT